MKLAVGLFFLSALTAAADYDPTEDLISAFGETCSVKGDLNQKARAQGQALASIISQMKSDDACKGLAPMVESLQGQLLQTSLEIDQAQIDRDRKREVAADIEQAIQVEKSKGALGDQNFILTAQTELNALRMDILRESRHIPAKKRRDTVPSINAASITANQILTALSSSSQCAAKQPNIAGQIVGRILGISAILNPGVRGALSLGMGSIFESLMNFFSDKKFNKAIAEVRRDQLRDGIGCGLEAMAATQCSARDTIITLKEANQNILNPPECSDSIKGAELLGRHMTSFVAWVREFNDVTNSSRSVDVLNDAAKAREYDNTYEQLAIAFSKTLAAASKSEETRSSQKELTNTMTSTATLYASGILRSIFDTDPECSIYLFFMSNGQTSSRDKLPENSNGFGAPGSVSPNCISYAASKNMTPPTTANIRATKDKLLAIVKTNIEERKKGLKTNDPNIVLAAAENKGPSGLSPIQILNGIQTYLTYLKNQPSTTRSDRAMNKMVSENLERVNGVLKGYDNTNVSEENLAKLIIQNVGFEDFLPNFAEIVRQDIERKVKSGETSEGFKMVALASNSSAIAELTTYVNDIERVYASANSAKVHSDSNLKAFMQTFSEPYEEILKDLSARASQSHAAKNMLGLSCMRGLLTRDPPSYLKNYCNNTAYEGLIGGNITYDEWKDKAYDQRVCSVYDYFRKTRLKESRGSLSAQ